MVKVLVSLFLVFTQALLSQDIAIFRGYDNSTRIFDSESSSIVSSKSYSSSKTGYDFIIYSDFSGRLYLYQKRETRILANTYSKFYASKYLFCLTNNQILKTVNNNEELILSLNYSDLSVEDSIIVYNDLPNSFSKVYYKDSIYVFDDNLNTSKNAFYISSDNILAFNSLKEQTIKVFYRGVVYNTYLTPDLNKIYVGSDVAAFYDRSSMVLNAFHNFQMTELEFAEVKNIVCLDGYFLYENNSGQMIMFDGKKRLAYDYFPDKYFKTDDVFIFYFNQKTYMLYNRKISLVCNYIPGNIILKNGIVIFKNSSGIYEYIFEGELNELKYSDIIRVEIQGQLIIAHRAGKRVEIIEP